MESKRGLIISCPLFSLLPSSGTDSVALDPQEVRFSLLFWDKLDFPISSLAPIPLDSEGELLEQSDVLQRTPINMQMGATTTNETRPKSDWERKFSRAISCGVALRFAFEKLNRQEPGVWSLGNVFHFDDGELEEGRGVLLRLYRAIPVPSQNVPLHEVLEFRTKRRAEQLALRHHLERIYQRVLRAGDGELAWNTEIESLQIAIADHIKTCRETKFGFRNMSLTASLNLVAGAATLAGAMAMHVPISAALLASAAASISISPGWKYKAAGTGTPYRYISEFHEDLFG